MNQLDRVAMTTVVPITSLPRLVAGAAKALAGARNAAEVLEAKERAGATYDMAKRSARFAKAQKAHDHLIEAAFRAQGDALKIESRAKARLAEEYERAVEKGEAAGRGRPNKLSPPRSLNLEKDFRLRDTLAEGRAINDAERKSPGITERAINEQLDQGKEPSRARAREAINAVIFGGAGKGNGQRPTNKNPSYKPDAVRDALFRLAALCRDVVKLCKEHKTSALVAKFVDGEQRQRSLKEMTAARKALDKFLMEAGS